MIIPVGDTGAQKLVLLTKTGDTLSQSDVIPVRFVPMIDPEGTRY